MNLLNRLKDSIGRELIRRSVKNQSESFLRNLGLWDLDVNGAGHISVDGADVTDLAGRYGSPLLVVNRKKLHSDAKAVLEAFSEAPAGSRVLYSYKTNCVPGILNELHGLGIGAEVISPYELWLAERLGVPGDMIVYNGVNKTEESIERAIRLKALSINIDSPAEIDLIYACARRLKGRANVGVRLGFSKKSQFGIEVEGGHAIEACRKIASLSDCLNLNTVHFNVASNVKDSSIHRHYAVKSLEFISEVNSKTGISIPFLDIGGGFGVQTTKNMSPLEYGLYRLFGCLPDPSSPEDCQPVGKLFRDIFDCVKETCGRLGTRVPSILIEPGRLVTSRSEFLLARVNSIKEKLGGPIFAITDAGRLSITFPCDFEYHEVFLANRPKDNMDTVYQVMGRICTSADWMFKNRYLPRLKPGDVLAVMDAGAYFSSYSSNFAFPRPAIVMVQDGESRLIRQKEPFEHLVAMDAMDRTCV